MERLKSSALFTFSVALRPWLDIRSTLRWAEGKAEKEVRGQPIIVLDDTARQRTVLQVRSFSVEQESGPDVAASMDGVMSKLATFPDPSILDSVASVRFDAFFIDPFDLAFHELNSRVKSAFLKPNEFTSPATDLMVVVDQATEDRIIDHLQLGPMLPDQLNRQFLAFRRQDAPDQFLFAGIGRTIMGPGAFALDWIETAARTFSTWADERAQKIAELVQG